MSAGRLRSDIFVAALIRRCAVDGAAAVLARRGAAEAGAIFVVVDRLDGQVALFAPAPHSEAGEDGVDRRFTRVHPAPWTDSATVTARLRKETRFDPDCWIVEIEDRLGRIPLDLAA